MSRHLLTASRETGAAPRIGGADVPEAEGEPAGSGRIAVRTHWSVAATAAFVAWVLATGYLPAAAPGVATALYWTVGVLAAAAFVLAILAHEVMHAVVARRCGLRVRGITLWLLGGVTDFDEDPRTPRADGWIAAAGPVANLALGGLAGGAAAAVTAAGVHGPGTARVIVSALWWLAEINVLLGLFNLVPAAPLDGGRVLRAVLWQRRGDRAWAAERATQTGRLLGAVLIGFGLLELGAGSAGGLWLALVGWYLLGAADRERTELRIRRVGDRAVEEVMTPLGVTAPAWWTVEHFLETATTPSPPSDLVPVVDLAGELTGLVRVRDLRSLHASRRATARVRDVAGRLRFATVPAGARAQDCLVPILSGQPVVVVRSRRPVGLVTSDDLDRAGSSASTTNEKTRESS